MAKTDSTKEELDQKKEEYRRIRLRESINIQIELYIWVLLAGILGWQWYYGRLQSGLNIDQFDLINIILISSVIVIIPLLSKTIFGSLPFQLLKDRLRLKSETTSNRGNNQNSTIDEKDTKLREEELAFFSSGEYLVHLCVSSDKLSRKLFGRSSTYLFIGSLIALIGIVYFSFQSIEIVQNKEANWEMLIQFIPRLGALFFIEFVAFFFLKQYRLTLDDFKYYESIKRQRESNLIVYKIQSDLKLSKNKDHIDLLLANLELFSNPTILKDNETTESLENRKFSNEEIDVLNNIVNQLGHLKT